MEPNLLVGSQYLVSKDINNINRGDVVVFTKDSTLYVKRVIGLPNDIINISDGVVIINGCPIEEPYLGERDTVSAQFYVPEDSLLLLGDNRRISNDSRYWENPYVKLDSVVGKVVLGLYPKVFKLEKYYYEVY